MNNFCTLFDYSYLSRGLVLYDSLREKTNENFQLYILALDKESFNTIKNLKLDFIKLIMLKDFENEKLLSVKLKRTKTEYYWTCTPWIIKYVLEKFSLRDCTYIDADLYFYNDPKILLDEIKIEDSVLITEHDYYKPYDQSHTSGKYCVQFMYFKNDKNGLKALNWWAEQCIIWCYNRHENGKFGDQKYIEEFPRLFKGIHVLQSKKQVLAPWNIQNYLKIIKNNRPVFYHFHGVKYLKGSKFFLGYYRLNRLIINLFYKDYIEKLLVKGYFNEPEIILSTREKIKIKLKNILNYNHTIKI